MCPKSISEIDQGNLFKLVTTDLAGSMFTRLFYYDGIGLDNFEMFYENKQVTGGDILVWKVNWEGNDFVNEIEKDIEEIEEIIEEGEDIEEINVTEAPENETE